jgi:hypothetical protein
MRALLWVSRERVSREAAGGRRWAGQEGLTGRAAAVVYGPFSFCFLGSRQRIESGHMIRTNYYSSQAQEGGRGVGALKIARIAIRCEDRPRKQ